MMPLGQEAVPRTHNTLSRCSVVPHTDTSTRCALQTQPVLSTLPTVGRYARSSSDKCAGFCHHHHRRPPVTFSQYLLHCCCRWEFLQLFCLLSFSSLTNCPQGPFWCILVLSPPVRAGGSTSPPPGPANTNTLN